MEFTLASFHRPDNRVSYITLSPKGLGEGQLKGQISLDVSENAKTVQYVLKESQDVLVAPYEFAINDDGKSHDISLRITGTDPKFSLVPEGVSEEVESPAYRFQLPTIETFRLTQLFLQEGLTEELIAEIRENYDQRRSPFLKFVSQAKYCLDYSQYTKLLDSAASVDERARKDLSNSRHAFFKNLVRGQKAGKQYPILNHDKLLSRISEYEKYEHLDSPSLTEIVYLLIDEASKHNTHIDEVCSLEKTFAVVAPDLDTGFFINILSESLLSEFEIQTVTKRFENNFGLSARELVKHRYNDWTVTSTFKDLNETAYETKSIGDREKALAASQNSGFKDFYQAISELLYWYTETTEGIPEEIQPQIYAVAANLYEKAGNEFLSDAATYRASVLEGQHLRGIHWFEDAQAEFYFARELANNWTKGPFDEVEVYVESILTDVAKHRESGDYMEASRKANYGYTELSEGDYRNRDTAAYETLLKAWETDMLAHSQSKKGQFQSAVETINDAIGGFRKVNEEGAAQTAQTHRHQLQAIQSQLNLDFDAAADQHNKAEEQAVNVDTKHIHRVHASLCTVKQHLIEDHTEEAREELSQHNFSETNINNLGILLDVYEDYLKGEVSPIESVIEELKTDDTEELQARHIIFDGDYVSAVVHIIAAQRLIQKNLPSSVLQHITQAVIKNTISGGTSREWTEVSELSQIDTERLWQLVIPSVIQKGLEYVEYTAEKGSHPNYAAPAMKLLASLEGYLRVIVEYYSKLEYKDQWRNEVVSRDEPTLGDIFVFFDSDDAADRIEASDEISTELEAVRYFDADSDITDVRNDLDHSNLADISERLFESLKSHVFEIMRLSAFDCPVIAEVENVTREHQIQLASCQLQWNRLPRRVEVGTETELVEGQPVYLPPEISIESGMATVDAQKIRRCELAPVEIVEKERM